MPISLKKNINQIQKDNILPFNDSPDGSTSHATEMNTNFSLRPINLIDVDKAVFTEFDRRFKIAQKDIPVTLSDAEIVSLNFQNWEQLDIDQTYLGLPMFLMTRTNTKNKFRTNPHYKQLMYAIPKQKPQGVVIEEWIVEGPTCTELTYEFIFASNYREHINQFEEQMSYYFRNRVNVILHEGERFQIRPSDIGELAKLESVNRNAVDLRTVYVLTYEIRVDAWLRSENQIQKRERPNSLTIEIKERSPGGDIQIDSLKLIDKNNIPNHK